MYFGVYSMHTQHAVCINSLYSLENFRGIVHFHIRKLAADYLMYLVCLCFQEMCVKYWPSGVGEAEAFGEYQVELSEDEKDRGDYITRRFKISALSKVRT